MVRKPGKPTLTIAERDQALDVTVALADHGTDDITKYQYQIKQTAGGSFGSWTDTTDGVSNTGGTFSITGLTNGTNYTVRVRAVSDAGESPQSAEEAVTVTPRPRANPP